MFSCACQLFLYKYMMIDHDELSKVFLQHYCMLLTTVFNTIVDFSSSTFYIYFYYFDLCMI